MQTGAFLPFQTHTLSVANETLEAFGITTFRTNGEDIKIAVTPPHETLAISIDDESGQEQLQINIVA